MVGRAFARQAVRFLVQSFSFAAFCCYSISLGRCQVRDFAFYFISQKTESIIVRFFDEGGVRVRVRGVSEVKQYPSVSGQKSTAKAITAKFLLSIQTYYLLSIDDGLMMAKNFLLLYLIQQTVKDQLTRQLVMNFDQYHHSTCFVYLMMIDLFDYHLY